MYRSIFFGSNELCLRESAEVRSVLNTCSERFLGHIIECLTVVAGNAQAAGAARATGVVLGIARFVDVTDNYGCEPRVQRGA